MRQPKYTLFLPILVTFLFQFKPVDCWRWYNEYAGIHAAREISSSNKWSVAELTRTAEQVTNRLASSLDYGLGRFANSFDKGLGRAANSFDNGVERIADSFDNGVDKAQQTIRELSQVVTNLTDGIQISIDSKDLAHAGKDAAESLQKAVSDLAEKWKVAISTEDLKSVGADAMEHLSKALQNLKAELHLHFSIDTNLMTAVKYVAIAIGIAFSVCFIAMIVSMKSCRKCFLSSLDSMKSFNCYCCTRIDGGATKDTNEKGSSKSKNEKIRNVRKFEVGGQQPSPLPKADVKNEVVKNRITLYTLKDYKGVSHLK